MTATLFLVSSIHMSMSLRVCYASFALPLFRVFIYVGPTQHHARGRKLHVG